MSTTVEQSNLNQLRARVRLRGSLPRPAVRRAIRTAAEVTLAEAGSVVGVSGESIRLYELGRRFPTGQRLKRYAALLNALQEELA